MIYDWKTHRWTLMASVEGQIGDCGNPDYPGLYVRISQKDVFDFIKKGKLKVFNTCIMISRI